MFEKTTRYYINLNQPKDERNVSIREIQDEKDKQKFEDKLIRCKNIVESTKDGIVLNELDNKTEQEYNEMIALKVKVKEYEVLIAELNEQVTELDKQLLTVRYELEQTNEIADIKPIETTEGHEDDRPNSVVEEITKVNSVPVNGNKDILPETKKKPVRRKMKRKTTKKSSK